MFRNRSARRWKKWGIWLGCLGLLALASLTLMLSFVADHLTRPANRLVGVPPERLALDSLRIVVPEADPVFGWLHEAEGAQASVLLLHPVRADRRSMLGRAELLMSNGYNVLLIDLPGHGESRGDAVTAGCLESRAVGPAVDFLRERFPNQPVGIVGWSLGGASTLLAEPANVNAVVLESVYPDIERAISNRLEIRIGFLHSLLRPLLVKAFEWKLQIDRRQLRPVDRIGRMACPVLIVSGDHDEHTRWADTVALFDASMQPKRLVRFRGAGHVDLLRADPGLYQSEVLDFLNRSLLGADPSQTRFGFAAEKGSVSLNSEGNRLR